MFPLLDKEKRRLRRRRRSATRTPPSPSRWYDGAALLAVLSALALSWPCRFDWDTAAGRALLLALLVSCLLAFLFGFFGYRARRDRA